MSDQISAFDPQSFVTEPYGRRIDKPWGYELHWVPDGLPYMAKVLCINAGQRLSLQLHDQKQESYLLIEGRATLEWQDQRGTMVTTELRPGMGYRTAVGQKHRLTALTDCRIVEASTPEVGTTWRLEDDYDRSDETPQQRAQERS